MDANRAMHAITKAGDGFLLKMRFTVKSLSVGCDLKGGFV